MHTSSHPTPVMTGQEHDDNDENDKKMMAMDGWHAQVITPNSSDDRTRK